MRRQLNGQMFVWLHVFACAARHLSFTRCAEELHITPGAVSQQMRQLEERLGYRLFLRRARGVELSAEGQRLAQTVAEAYGSIEAELLRLDAGKSAAHCVCVRSLVPGQMAHAALTAFSTALPGHRTAPGRRRQRPGADPG